MIWTNGFDFFVIIEIFWCDIIAVRLRLFFAIFDFFNNFLRLENLAQTSYTEFLINTKLQNIKSNDEILLERANTLFFVFKIKNSKF